jgi:adenylyl- and sulfurtransferase ThiI
MKAAEKNEFEEKLKSIIREAMIEARTDPSQEEFEEELNYAADQIEDLLFKTFGIS